MLSDDDASYYCSPSMMNAQFKIHKCSEIQSVELIDNEVADSAMTGAILFGVAGAVVGASRKKSVIIVRLHTADMDNPIVDMYVLSMPLLPKDKIFVKCYENAKLIYGYFKAIAEKNAADKNNADAKDDTDDVVEKIKKFKALCDEGIISQEEFEAKKKQLLNM